MAVGLTPKVVPTGVEESLRTELRASGMSSGPGLDGELETSALPYRRFHGQDFGRSRNTCRENPPLLSDSSAYSLPTWRSA